MAVLPCPRSKDSGASGGTPTRPNSSVRSTCTSLPDTYQERLSRDSDGFCADGEAPVPPRKEHLGGLVAMRDGLIGAAALKSYPLQWPRPGVVMAGNWFL